MREIRKKVHAPPPNKDKCPSPPLKREYCPKTRNSAPDRLAISGKADIKKSRLQKSGRDRNTIWRLFGHIMIGGRALGFAVGIDFIDNGVSLRF